MDSVSDETGRLLLSTVYITANLELVTPRFSERATPIFRLL